MRWNVNLRCLRQRQEIIMLEIHQLDAAMRSLTDEEREIIERLFFDDESLSSVARKKKVSYQAIQSRKNSILAKLKKFFEEK